MDVYEALYVKCTFCDHYLAEHYSTYTLGAPNRRPSYMGCAVKYIIVGDKYEEKVTMESERRACPCEGFAEILLRDEHGLISPRQ